ncbi:hypothetical protein [Marinomonas sp. GJ51-6]|uniref:hypothetical protein n=1 Tax=Marinomonas sp. GJ51-6 TaxID=2992802 RepID=UPI002934881F|nr:hypothetical protein [Marinomonas sp. GJ51-6]WOD09215.1 hypothetical protein ONZ50_09425 [Marinomonas sp. GJ51-6]
MKESEGLADFHWMFDMLHHIDVGLVVLNTKYEIQLWNSFMENHSGVSLFYCEATITINAFSRFRCELVTSEAR